MRESITDLEKNLELNRSRWGDLDAWSERDQFGYRWGGGVQQATAGISKFADRFLRPHVSDRYDHKVLELSPGAGRFTAELIRYAESIDLLDMNQACLDICEERFRYIPTPMRFYLNDGEACDMLEPDARYSVIACFDSMVHMHPDIIDGYVRQLSAHLAEDGVMWLDTSGKGAREQGHRTDMTEARMAEIASSHRLEVVEQTFRNDHDLVTVLRR